MLTEANLKREGLCSTNHNYTKIKITLFVFSLAGQRHIFISSFVTIFLLHSKRTDEYSKNNRMRIGYRCIADERKPGNSPVTKYEAI
jgi:hypothetical protein